MNMNIEDQRAVEKAAGPAVSPYAAFGPGPQSCRAGVMPLQDGASQFNLLKPVKGCSSQFADKVPCIPPSTRDPGSTLQHPNGPHLQKGASQLSLLKPVKGCLSQFADKVHSLAPREVQPVAVPDTSSPQCQQIPPPDTSSQQFADKVRRIQALCRPARFILHRRRAGKIARLPQHVRDEINIMLLDGLTYDAIIARLGPLGEGLNKDNLSRWRKADYQDWLAEQTWLQATTNRPQPSPETKDLAFLLHEMDADSLRETVARNPDRLNRILNFCARLMSVSDAKTQDLGRRRLPALPIQVAPQVSSESPNPVLRRPGLLALSRPTQPMEDEN
jgi:hypothetical protein